MADPERRQRVHDSATIAGGATQAPPSPMSFAPNGLSGDGVTVRSRTRADGMADPLREAADDLALDQQRVDRVAAVVHRDDAIETHLTGIAVDGHDRDRGAEAPCRMILPEEHGRFEVRRFLRRQPDGTMGELADATQPGMRSGTPLTRNPPGTVEVPSKFKGALAVTSDRS